MEGGWETTKSRKSRSKIPQSSCYTPQDLSRDQSSEIHIIPEDAAEEYASSDIVDQTGTGTEVYTTKKSREIEIEITNEDDDADAEAPQSISQDDENVREIDFTKNYSENCATTTKVEATSASAELETVMEVSEVASGAAIEPNSAPASRKSTLKRSKNKKRSSLDGGSGTGTGNEKVSSVLSRPVLISDGDYDVASAAAALRVQKNAFDVLDQDKLQELKKLKSCNTGNGTASMDTLYVSDIGYGMLSGPIGLGRFGLGKYIPPSK